MSKNVETLFKRVLQVSKALAEAERTAATLPDRRAAHTKALADKALGGTGAMKQTAVALAEAERDAETAEGLRQAWDEAVAAWAAEKQRELGEMVVDRKREIAALEDEIKEHRQAMVAKTCRIGDLQAQNSRTVHERHELTTQPARAAEREVSRHERL